MPISDINQEINHSHDPDQLRMELCKLLDTSNLKVEYLTVAAVPLSSIATSTSVLTFVSMFLFFNSQQSIIRLLAGLNIIVLLSMVFMSLFTQIMIYQAKLRLTRINHDRVVFKEFNDLDQVHLVRLSHLAKNSTKIVDRIQWLYVNGLFRVLYVFLIITVSLLILLIFFEIPAIV